MVNIYDVINNQYPHRLYIRTCEGEATQDEHGAWRPSGGGFRLFGPCREETNGRGNKIRTAGGEYVVFSSSVYIPQANRKRIPEGTEIAVAEEELTEEEIKAIETTEGSQELVMAGKLRIAGECLKFDLGRLHSRLWV